MEEGIRDVIRDDYSDHLDKLTKITLVVTRVYVSIQDSDVEHIGFGHVLGSLSVDRYSPIDSEYDILELVLRFDDFIILFLTSLVKTGG